MILRCGVYMFVKFDEYKYIQNDVISPNHHAVLSDCLGVYYILEVITITVVIHVHVKNITEDWGENRSQSQSIVSNKSLLRSSLIKSHTNT